MELEGIVRKSTGSWYLVRTGDGKEYECRIKGKFRIQGFRATNPVAVGDRVTFRLDPHNVGLIQEIKERTNYIIRKATRQSKALHVIAANIDQTALIITLAYPRTSRGFIDRYLVTAEAYHIPAALIFNKIDLYDEKTQKYHYELIDVYRKAGYPCFATSATRGDHVEELKPYFKDKVTLLSGHSGVGKSALINALDPSKKQKVASISRVHKIGKHTTTFAEMLDMGFGGTIIDTPGIKEFGLYDFDPEEVAERFPEMRARMHECKFHNCTHVHEPKCAVKKAVEDGEIDKVRYENYLSILNDDYFKIKEWD